MSEAPNFRKRSAPATWCRRARQIALVLMVGAMLAGCDRCGDLAFQSTMACRQDAPKPQ